MTGAPVQVVVAAFQTEQGADRTLHTLKAERSAGRISIDDAVVLRRDNKNRLHVSETGDWGGGKGAAVGGVLGAIVGLIAGPGAVVVGAAGAVVGGLAARLRDSGFEDERLRRLGESLQPGTSALVAIVEHKWMTEYERHLVEGGADPVREEVAAKMAQMLAPGGEITYTALGMDESIVIEDAALGEGSIEA